METEFEHEYDCQIQFQYAFNGKKKNYYPIISNLHLSDDTISLEEFSEYPIVAFHSCKLTNITITSERLRDLNFQDSNVKNIVIQMDQFGGTLGFANSTISFNYLKVTSCPKILAVVESVILDIKNPLFEGFDKLHTLAIINSSLDYLDIKSLLDNIVLDQLMITEIQSGIPLELYIPKHMKSLKLKNLTLDRLPNFTEEMLLETLSLEEVEIINLGNTFKNIDRLYHLRELIIKNTSIKLLPDLDLPNLELLHLGSEVVINEKMRARLKFSGITIGKN